MKTPKIIVIGAGIGGITAAIHLAKGGCQVTVYEKNDQPGGRVDIMRRQGHTFAVSYTHLTLPTN